MKSSIAVKHQRPKNVVGLIRVKSRDIEAKHKYNDSLTQTVKFINFTEGDLRICNRHGVTSTITPTIREGDIAEQGLLICYSTTGTKASHHVMSGIESEVVNAVRTSLLDNDNKTIYWEEFIPVADINSARTGIYVRNSDVVVISYMFNNYEPVHYACDQVSHDNMLSMVNGNAASAINVSIRIVDNEDTIGPRYGIFQNRVVYLSTLKDMNLTSGLYVTGLVELDGNNNSIRKDAWFSVSDMDSGNCPLEVYKTAESAHTALATIQNKSKVIEASEAEADRTHRAMMNERKREYELNVFEQEQERKLLDLRKLREEDDIRRITVERDRLLSELKHAREMESTRYSTTAYEQKSQHASRLAAQQNSGDLMKLGGMLIAGTFGLYKLLG